MKKNEINIQLKLEAIKKLDYSEKSYQIFEDQQKPISDANINIENKIGFFPEKKQVIINIGVTFTKNISDKNYELFSLTTSNIFKISNYEEVIINNLENQLKAPNELMILLFDISISNTRGMLSVLNTKAEYSSLLLPIIAVEKIKNILKLHSS